MIHKVLFIISIPTQFNSLVPFAEFLTKNGRYQPVFFLDSSLHNLEKEQQYCIEKKYLYTTYTIENSYKCKKYNSILSLLLTIANFICYRISNNYKEFFAHLRNEIANIKNILSKIELLLITSNIKIIISSEASVGYNAPHFINVAHKLRIPFLTMPFAVTNKDDLAEYYLNYLNTFEVKGFIRKIIAVIYPKWTYTHKGKKLFPITLKDILALEIMQIAPKNPWTYNGMDVTKLVLDNEFLKEYFVAEGVTNEKIVILGAIYLDVFDEKLKNKQLYTQNITNLLNFKTRKPIILCAIPPDFYPNNNYKSYDIMIEEWLKMFRQQIQYNVIISLHPRSLKETFLHIEQDNIKIFNGNIIEIISLCDIFVASASATIRMALACKKIVLNYDVFQWKETNYQNIDTVITVNNNIDFLREFNLLTSSKEYLEQKTERYKEYKDFFGKVDGKSGERIVGLLDELI